jgi:hypothetical protein
LHNSETLQNEIKDSKRWIECTQEDSTYKRDLEKRIELIDWVLQNTNNPYIPIWDLIESKMNVIIHKLSQMDDAIEANPLHSELRILGWILYIVYSNEVKKV